MGRDVADAADFEEIVKSQGMDIQHSDVPVACSTFTDGNCKSWPQFAGPKTVVRCFRDYLQCVQSRFTRRNRLGTNDRVKYSKWV